jgi:nitrate/nitrite transporter NarK
MIGSLLFGSLPGVIADLTGSYVPFYLLLSVLALASMILTQISYKRMKRVAAHSTGAKADNLGVGVLSDSHS